MEQWIRRNGPGPSFTLVFCILLAVGGGVACDTSLDAPEADSGITGNGDDVTDGSGQSTRTGDTSGGTDSPSVNACGGEGPLRYAGGAGELLASCGCGGVLVCNGLHALRCIGEQPTNACGGCGVLEGSTGETCGPCGGSWVCGAEGEAICVGAGRANGCGGCAPLAGAPGRRCASGGVDDGTWVCGGPDDVECRELDGDENACGGEGALLLGGAPVRPGDACEDDERLCGAGVVVCNDARDGVDCEGRPRNAIGGCGTLVAEPGSACGCGGTWLPDADAPGGLRCDGDAFNACGGCSVLDTAPGTSCGQAEVVVCVGEDDTICVPISSDRNGCGGTSSLDGTPDNACGACNTGRWACTSPNRVTCAGDAGQAAFNPCDGSCTPLASGVVGGACGTCDAATLACGEGADLVCVGDAGNDARNVCGGCSALAGVPEEPCGRCASWRCSSDGEIVRCVVDPQLPGCEDEPLRCADLVPTCNSLNRDCDEGGSESGATCGACLSGFEEVAGACVDPGSLGRTCEEAGCDAENRECVQPAPDVDAECGACMPEFEDVDGACVDASALGRTCGQAGCASQNRECIQPDPEVDAQCGACLQGFQEVGGACSSSLAAPTGVTASQGTSAAHVVVSWQAVTGATGYHVYRNGTRVTSSPLTATSYNDSGAPPGGAPDQVSGLEASTNRNSDVFLTWIAADVPDGASREYAVRAESETLQSALSDGATGFRAGQPVAGYQVQVESGSWIAAGSATNWLDTSAPPGSLDIGTPTATTNLPDRVDLASAPATRTPGATRNYRVRAVNASGTGEASSPAQGRRAVGEPTYQWQWSSTSGGNFVVITGQTSLSASDTDIAAGESRWYRIRAAGNGAQPVHSSPVQGARTGSTSQLGDSCTGSGDCPAGAWCPTNTTERHCAPRMVRDGAQMRFQWVPSGTFTMGSPQAENGRYGDEDQVPVTLTRNIFVQRTPVTQGQWRTVLEEWNGLPASLRTTSGWNGTTPQFPVNPSFFGTQGTGDCTSPQCPVERVNWYDAVVFTNILSQLEGLEPCYTLTNCTDGAGSEQFGAGCGSFQPFCTSNNFQCGSVEFVGKDCTGYRLPTEAEWEYAVRAGTTTSTYLGILSTQLTSCTGVTQPNLDPIAWWCGNSGGRTDGTTQIVAGLQSNAWGLFDMLGNVGEWTWSIYINDLIAGEDPLGAASGDRRTVRGGSWFDAARDSRAAVRTMALPADRADLTGFRLVRSAPR